MLKNKTVILITGGCGFIGSCLIRFLIKKKNLIIVNFDKLTYSGNIDNLNTIKQNPRYFFIRGDICNKKDFKSAVHTHKPKIVFNLAAHTHVDRSIKSSKDFINTNILGVYNILEILREYYNNLKEQKKNFRFLHISTDEVYGDLGKNNNKYFTEKTAYNPSSPYSSSKAAADHLVRSWYRTYSLPSIVTRCSNNYGPFQYPEKLIPLIIINAINKKKLPVYGNGNQIRDWLHVEDHVRALWVVAKKGIPGETYNIGGNNEYKNLETVRIICGLLDNFIKEDVKYFKLVDHVKDRLGHDVRYAIDAKKIKNKLGWKPYHKFEFGLKKTVQWYLENKWWWEKILKKNKK
jgi:dTDP-glucose 4,6-dehydratase